MKTNNNYSKTFSRDRSRQTTTTVKVSLEDRSRQTTTTVIRSLGDRSGQTTTTVTFSQVCHIN